MSIETKSAETQSEIGMSPDYGTGILSGIGTFFAAYHFTYTFWVTYPSPLTMAVIGALFMAVGVATQSKVKTTFLLQLIRSLVITGNLALVFGLLYKMNDAFMYLGFSNDNFFLTAVIIQTMICALVYPIYKDDIVRFSLVLLTNAAAIAWAAMEGISSGVTILITVQMLAVGFLFILLRPNRSLNPMRYAFAISLIATILVNTYFGTFASEDSTRLFPCPSSVILSIGMILMYLKFAGLNKAREEWLILAVVSTLLLGLLTTPGVLIALGYLVLGHGQRDKVLTVMGIVFLPVFLVRYYYFLDVDLFYKSWVMAGSGLILLGARWISQKRPWAEEGAK